jgi:hypothetical protein
MRSITNTGSLPAIIPTSQAESNVPDTTQAPAGGIWSSAATLGSQKITANPIIEDPGDWRRHNDVSQLDQAEALAQDAFRKVSLKNPSASDKFLAQSEMFQAQIIRNQVEKDLTPSQQQSLEQINSEEQQAFTDATSGGSFFSNVRGGFAVAKMIDGANKSKALDNSILGVPNPPPPFPILNLPFGKIS